MGNPWAGVKVGEPKVLLAYPDDPDFAIVQVGEKDGRSWIVPVRLRENLVGLPRSFLSATRCLHPRIEDFRGDPEPFLALVRKALNLPLPPDETGSPSPPGA